MTRTGLAKTLYLHWLSKPVCDRALYRRITQLKANSVVEFGVGNGTRSLRMIACLLRNHPSSDVYYTGIDLFEARASSNPGLSLKRAHALLAAQGVHVRLVPGDPCSALARSANALAGTDVIVIGDVADPLELGDAWFYLPRMLHNRSLVLQAGAGGRYLEVSPASVAENAAAAAHAKQRAA